MHSYKLFVIILVVFSFVNGFSLDYVEPDNDDYAFVRDERNVPEFGRLRQFWQKNHVS
jgi:hypothetical protein